MIIAAEHLPSELTGLPDLGAALREMARRFEPAHTCDARAEGQPVARRREGGPHAAFEVHVEDDRSRGRVQGGIHLGWLRAGADPNVHDVLRYAHGVGLNCRGLGARDALPGPPR